MSSGRLAAMMFGQKGQVVRYLELRGDQVEFRGTENSLSPNEAVFEVLRKSGADGGVTLTLKP